MTAAEHRRARRLEQAAARAFRKLPRPTERQRRLAGVADTHSGALSARRAMLASTSGDAVAFGDDSQNELGDFPDCGGSHSPARKSIRQAVPIPSAVTQLAVSGYWMEALHSDGTVSAWGENALGALGVGPIGPNGQCAQAGPKQVPISGVISVATGTDHTLFLTTGGLYASGADTGGDLGRGSFCCGYFKSPVRSTAIPSSVVAIATAGTTSYALQSGGTVLAFGSNDQGQLGAGNTTPSNSSPVTVPGLSNVIAISASMTAGYALKADGTVWAWGSNVNGALGNGTLTAGVSGPAQVVGLSNVVALGSGSSTLSGYAIKSDGTVWAWGANDSGQLGNGNTTPSGSPVQVQGLQGAVQVSASSKTAMAVTSAQKAYAWGDNRWGQLGNGSYGSKLTPTQVAEVPGAVAVAAGELAGAASANIPTPGPLPSYYGPGDGRNPSGIASPCIQHLCGDPVNTATGALVESYDDMSTPGRGAALHLQRTYSSAVAHVDGPFGRGWNWSYGISLAVDVATGVVTVAQENGSQVQFTPSGASYSTPAFIDASLMHNGDGTWTMTRKRRLKLTFDAQGRLTRETDLNGYATVTSYPSASQEVITDPAGRTITLTIAGGHITQAVDTASPGRSVHYAYANGDLTRVTDVAGGVTTFGYDANHLLTSMRQPKYDGDTTTTPTPVATTHYDANGRVDVQTDQLGRQTTYDYTTVGGATLITDPKANKTLDRYVNGRLVSSTKGYGTAAATTSRYFYDPNAAELTASCDGLDDCATRTYDSAGNVLTSQDPMGRTTTNTYDALDDVLTTTDPGGTTTTFTYDSAGNVLTKATPLKNASGTTIATRSTTHGYGGTTPVYPGDVTSMTDPRGKVWQYRYDAYGDLISETAPATAENTAGNKTTHSYNTAAGLLISTTRPRGNVTGANPSQFTTTYSYDPFGRLTQTKDPLWASSAPLQHEKTIHRDLNGNVDYAVDANGNKTTYTYDAANQLITTGLPDGTSTSQDYYPDGSLWHYVGGRGKTTTYTYNAAGQQTTVTDGAGRTTTFQPDAAGNVVWEGKAGSNCTTTFDHCVNSAYDADHELVFRTYYDGTTNISNISYNALGKRTAMTDSTGTSSWTYDNLGRLTASTDGNGNTVGYAYDIASNQTSITYPGSLVVTRDYDDAGRIDWIQDYQSNKTTFAYNEDSQLLKTTEPTAAGVTDALSYDNAGRQLTSTTANGSTTLAKFVYTRDGAGQMLTDTTTGITDPAHSYAYDQLERLKTSGTAAAPVNHGYDADSDLLARTNTASQAYDDAGQVCWTSTSAVSNPSCGSTPSGATTYSYNGQGDRTAATPASGAAKSYGYDFDDNLISYGTTATYKYDATGLRLYKKVGSTVQKLVWDRSASLPMLLADGTNRYIYGPDGAPLEQISSSNVVTFLHHDQLGSTRLLTSSSGANSGTYSYDAFGSVTTHTGTGTTPLQYAGQYIDGESGLSYMRARNYDPATGQFISRDPLEDQTRQPYAYAGNSPTAATDPSGLICIDPTGVTCGVQNAVTDMIGAAGNLVYNNAGTISTVASVGAFIPGVNVVAAPIALTTGALQGYRDVRSENYVGAVLDVGGVLTGGASVALERQAAADFDIGRRLYANATLREWFLADAARKAQFARVISTSSFVASSLVNPFANPEDAYALGCLP